MASRGRGRRGRPLGASQTPPVFDQQAFTEAMIETFASFTQVSATGSQGGSSNLQRFKSHHPSTFIGEGDPMVVDHWFIHIEKELEAMEITFNATKIRLAVFQLEGESQVWWDWVETSRDMEAMTWTEFHELFMGKYVPTTVRYAKA